MQFGTQQTEGRNRKTGNSRNVGIKRKITVAALIQKTGFSKGFFYRNEEMRRVVNEAMHQQSVTYNPKQIIIDMAMERTLVNAKTTIQELKLKIKNWKKKMQSCEKNWQG